MRNLISKLLPILFASFLLFSIVKCNRAFNKNLEMGGGYVGERVAVDGDTLTITNFKVFRDEFVLSNGSTIHYKALDKFLIKE
jgi:hypothetical protein